MRSHLCEINAFAANLGSLDRVNRIVKVVGFVASDPAFTGQAVCSTEHPSCSARSSGEQAYLPAVPSESPSCRWIPPSK